MDRWLYGDLLLLIVCFLVVWLSFEVPELKGRASVRVLRFAFLVFVPGYALISGFFPRKTVVDAPNRKENRIEFDLKGSNRGVLERVVLSLGLSVAIVSLTAFGLNVASIKIGPPSLLLYVGGITAVATGIAAIRRGLLPEEERFTVSITDGLIRIWPTATDSSTRADSALNALLVIAAVAGVTLLVYAIVVPTGGESFTLFAVLSEDENGRLIAGDYPAESEPGETRNVTLRIENHENRKVSYTTIVELQRFANDSATHPVKTRELDRLSVTLTDDDTWTREYGIEPPMPGPRLRVTFLLYKSQPPPTPSVDNAYRAVHFWINVSPVDGASTSLGLISGLISLSTLSIPSMPTVRNASDGTEARRPARSESLESTPAGAFVSFPLSVHLSSLSLLIRA